MELKCLGRVNFTFCRFSPKMDGLDLTFVSYCLTKERLRVTTLIKKEEMEKIAKEDSNQIDNFKKCKNQVRTKIAECQNKSVNQGRTVDNERGQFSRLDQPLIKQRTIDRTCGQTSHADQQRTLDPGCGQISRPDFSSMRREKPQPQLIANYGRSRTLSFIPSRIARQMNTKQIDEIAHPSRDGAKTPTRSIERQHFPSSPVYQSTRQYVPSICDENDGPEELRYKSLQRGRLVAPNYGKGFAMDSSTSSISSNESVPYHSTRQEVSPRNSNRPDRLTIAKPAYRDGRESRERQELVTPKSKDRQIAHTKSDADGQSKMTGFSTNTDKNSCENAARSSLRSRRRKSRSKRSSICKSSRRGQSLVARFRGDGSEGKPNSQIGSDGRGGGGGGKEKLRFKSRYANESSDSDSYSSR